MNALTTADGVHLAIKDWGSGRPVVFCHGWPISSDAWEAQMFFLSSQGYRTIAHDRRGYGRSSLTWKGADLDTYADDLAAVIAAMELRDVVLVGHAAGGAEIARYISRHGTTKVGAVVLVGATPPLMIKTSTNSGGLPREVFEQQRASVQSDRSEFLRDLATFFYGANRPGSRASKSLLNGFWLDAMKTCLPSLHAGIRIFSEASQASDLRKITVPTLIIHGDDDQMVPIGSSALKASSLLPRPFLKVYAGAPHGLFATHASRLNQDLLEFLQADAT